MVVEVGLQVTAGAQEVERLRSQLLTGGIHAQDGPRIYPLLQGIILARRQLLLAPVRVLLGPGGALNPIAQGMAVDIEKRGGLGEWGLGIFSEVAGGLLHSQVDVLDGLGHVRMYFVDSPWHRSWVFMVAIAPRAVETFRVMVIFTPRDVMPCSAQTSSLVKTSVRLH